MVFEARHLTLGILSEIYAKSAVDSKDSLLADFKSLTSLLDIDYEPEGSHSSEYIVNFFGLVYQTNLGNLYHRVKVNQDTLEDYQRLLTNGILRLSTSDEFDLKDKVFFPHIFRILREMDVQERGLGDPRYKLLVEFINRHMRYEAWVIHDKDLEDFLCVIASLKNITPFYDAINYSCSRLSSVSPEIFSNIKKRLEIEGRENLLNELKPRLPPPRSLMIM